MLHGILVLLLAPVLAAQTPAAGSIGGVVRDAGTGVPLAAVPVYLGANQAVTDSAGHFHFGDVPAGSQRLWASDKTRGASAGLSVLVRTGEEADVEIRLKFGGTITGHVVDSAGRPVPNAVVMVLSRRYRYGELVFSPSQSVGTDEAGGFRLIGVTPDQGVLLLAKKVLAANPVEELPPYDQRATVLAPELHPETITLSSGETRDRVEIRMSTAAAYCIEGATSAPPAGEPIFVRITEHLSFDTGWSLTPAVVKASVNGRFRACGLHPGAYRVAASPVPPAVTLADRFAVDAATLANGEALITDKDVLDVKLFEPPSVAIAGDAGFDPAPREKSRGIQIDLTRSVSGGTGYADATDKPGSFMMGGMMGTGRGTEVPGTFNLGRWRHGDWDLRVSSLPAGCYVKEAAYGRQDLRHAPLRISDLGDAGRIRLVIGCDGGSFTARVTNQDGAPVPGAFVYLFSAGAATPGNLAATFRRADVAAGWSMPLTALPPGKYLALVTDLDVNPLAAPADEIEKLWSMRGSAKEVEIGPGAVVQIAISYNSALR